MADDFNTPVFRKRMVLCTPFGPYINGDDKGDMTPERLQEVAENAKAYPRNRFVYVGGDHVFDPDERDPDGWVESVEWDPSYPAKQPGQHPGALIGDVKLHGVGAVKVAQDIFRGGSIGIQKGRNPDGSSQGWVLQHFLITNNGFDKSVDIAAAAADAVVSYFTAIPKEPDMADPKKEDAKDSPPPGDDKVAALKEKEDTIISLKAETLRKNDEIEALREQLANAKADVDKETALAENINLRRKDFLRDVRAIVEHGLHAGTLLASEVEGYAGASPLDFAATERWLKASKFHDASMPNPEQSAFQVLKHIATKTKPRVIIGGGFKSGTPTDNGTVTLTDEDRARMKERGQDPDRVASLSDDDDYAAWKRKKAAAGGSR